MSGLALHAGTGHPELAWLVSAGIVALAVGLAIGLFSRRVRSWFGRDPDGAPTRE